MKAALTGTTKTPEMKKEEPCQVEHTRLLILLFFIAAGRLFKFKLREEIEIRSNYLSVVIVHTGV